jgi:hypothetical protein
MLPCAFSCSASRSYQVRSLLALLALLVQKYEYSRLRSAGIYTSGVFNAQDVANTLWALATMKMAAKEDPSDQVVGLLRLLEARAEVISGSQFTCFTSTKVSRS